MPPPAEGVAGRVKGRGRLVEDSESVRYPEFDKMLVVLFCVACGPVHHDVTGWPRKRGEWK